MQTAMSLALARVGLITEEQARDITCLPRHLKTYQEQIEEISLLAGLMKNANINASGTDTLVYIAYRLDLESGRYAEGFQLMLSHLKKRVAELGLV